MNKYLLMFICQGFNLKLSKEDWMKEKTVVTKLFICETCGHEYTSRCEAENCESVPVTHSENLPNIGDKVRITYGDGAGKLGEVERIFIEPVLGDGRSPEKYAHTPGLIANIVDSWGTRVLMYDWWEAIGDDRKV
jgi:hypothetical protein